MYFIYDCNGNIVGNPKGYRTYNGAERQQNSKKSIAYKAIWDAYYLKAPNPANNDRLVCSIKLIEG